MTSIDVESALKGLGTNLSILSFLLNTADNINFTTDAKGVEWLTQFKTIFNLSNINIVEKENVVFDTFRDMSKAFDPYFIPGKLTLFGKDYPIKNTRKPCIGFACYHNADQVFNAKDFESNYKGWPRNRQYPIEDWNKIFQLVRESGYDVITFDSRDIDLESKVYLLNEMCDAVISYEGGIAHLAHVLQLPVIMLPVHHPSNIIDGLEIPLEERDWQFLLHLDLKTHFLQTINEIHSWTPDVLVNTIENLKNNSGNNKILNSKLILFSNNNRDFRLDDNKPRRTPYTLDISEFERNIMFDVRKNIKMGGVVPVYRVRRFL